MARKKSYPGGFRLTLATARRLAVQEFGTAKGLEPDRGTCLEGFFTMQMGNMGVSISPDLGMSGCIMVRAGLCTASHTCMPMRDHTTASVIRALNRLERKYGKDFCKLFKSITVDNGSEFADCAGMEKSCRRKGKRTKLYYCHPYSAYERGSNENMNRMIRWFFPKGTNFDEVTDKDIQRAEDWINSYPRRVLGWRSANAAMRECLAQAA